MFANPIWSLLILAGLVAMYVIMRIRHGGPLMSAYLGSGGWLGQFATWVVKFRSWVAALVFGLGVALPDVLVQITTFDFSPWIGPDYAKLLTTAFSIFTIINTAMKAKPPGQVA